MQTIDEQDMLEDYLSDARDQLKAIKGALAGIDAGPAALGLGVGSCYLAFRSIKAGAGFLDQLQVSTLAAIGEEVFFNLRQQTIRWSPAVADLIKEVVTSLSGLLNEAQGVDEEDIATLRRQTQALLESADRPTLGLTALLRRSDIGIRPRGSEVKTAPTFGEYLLHTELVTVDQLVEALVVQERGEVGHMHVLVEHGGLSAQAVLDLINDARDLGLDVLILAQQRQLLSPEAVKAIDEAIRRSRPPLGQILVELGLGDRRQIKNWLLDFYDQTRPDADEQAAAKSLTGTRLAQRQANLAAARGEDLPEADETVTDPVDPVAEPVTREERLIASVTIPEVKELTVEGELITDFLQVFNQDLQNEVEAALLSLRDLSGDELVTQLDGIYRQLHSLKGSCGFIAAVVSQQVVHLMEESISLLRSNVTIVTVEQVDDFTDLLLLGLDYCWELRTAIREFRDESRMLEVLGDDLQCFLDRLARAMAHHAEVWQEAQADEDVDDLF